MTDPDGNISLPGQVGAWNELLMGVTNGANYHDTSTMPGIAGLRDGDGSATSLSFTFNTSNTTYTIYTEPQSTALHRDACYVVTARPVAYWQLTGLQPLTYYTLRMFGQQTAGVPLNFASFIAAGAGAAAGSTMLTKNYVDLTVASTAGGAITGTLESNERTSSWSGMQILKGSPCKPMGSVIMLMMHAPKLSDIKLVGLCARENHLDTNTINPC